MQAATVCAHAALSPSSSFALNAERLGRETRALIAVVHRVDSRLDLPGKFGGGLNAGGRNLARLAGQVLHIGIRRQLGRRRGRLGGDLRGSGNRLGGELRRCGSGGAHTLFDLVREVGKGLE